jgi:hypothetical protein
MLIVLALNLGVDFTVRRSRAKLWN